MGSMRILLVNPGHQTSLSSMTSTTDITGCPGYMPNIALPTLAALAPDDVELTIFDENIEPLDPYLHQHWDLVGITGYITQRERIFALASEFRQRGRLVAIGGPYASLSAATVRPHADVLFIGEAEQTWPEFLSDLRAGSWRSEYRTLETVDLNSSPLPAIATLKDGAYLAGVVQSSRGCPFECEFCDVIVYLSRKQRYKTPARVVEELEQFYQAGYRSVFLADDNFTAYRKQATATLVAIDDWNRGKRERVQLATQLSIDAARDPELLDLAARAGIKQVFIGIETPSHEALREAKKRQNVRADLVADIRMFQARGISVQAGIIVGFDADTRDSFAAQFEFLQRAGIPSVLVNMLSAPEGTPLERRMRSENRLTGAPPDAGHMGTNIVPKHMTAEELRRGAIWLLNKLFSPENFLRRVAVLAEHSPPAAFSLGWAPARYAALWKNIRQAYHDLGPEFRRVPVEAVKLCHGKEATMLGTALIFHIHNVRVLRKQGMWNPALAQRSAPDFDSVASAEAPVACGAPALGGSAARASAGIR
jgi:radical SAM superfamily enzyme YgiQ (UPF0313 family)